MKAQRITLHDIAELAGVTKMTVSRYLRTPEKVKPETAERIASVIAEIGYQPDPDNPAMTSVAVPRHALPAGCNCAVMSASPVKIHGRPSLRSGR